MKTFGIKNYKKLVLNTITVQGHSSLQAIDNLYRILNEPCPIVISVNPVGDGQWIRLENGSRLFVFPLT
jgi:hypothetical protein